MNCARVRGHRGHFSAWRLYFIATLKRPYFLSFSPTVRVCARIIDQGLMCLIRSIDSNMADLGLHITLLPISRQALPSSAATCQNQLLVLQIGLCLFLYVFPVFELLSVLFCSVLLCLGPTHLSRGAVGPQWRWPHGMGRVSTTGVNGPLRYIKGTKGAGAALRNCHCDWVFHESERPHSRQAHLSNSTTRDWNSQSLKLRFRH